jgi:hypothetical protein
MALLAEYHAAIGTIINKESGALCRQRRHGHLQASASGIAHL